MEKTLVSIRDAAQILGVVPQTLRRWEREGKIFPDERTPGGKRRYSLASLEKFGSTSKTVHKTKKIFAYTRVARKEFVKDSQHQKQLLEIFCAKQGWVYELVNDMASGMEYNRLGLSKIIQEIFAGKVSHFLITHSCVLFTYGNELFFEICKAKSVQIIILNNSEQPAFTNNLREDCLDIVDNLHEKMSQNSLGKLVFSQATEQGK